jgi:ribosomal protein S18 acetylase RimI-like enzyme
LLINITHKLDNPEIKELISYSVFPDPEKLEEVIKQYQSEEALTLYGYEDENVLVGIIGVLKNENNTLVIKHIAVQPENRLKGYGRGLILELLEDSRPTMITAETDADAVDFYRSIGFTVYSLGELYPGVERFRCVYEIEPEDEL